MPQAEARPPSTMRSAVGVGLVARSGPAASCHSTGDQEPLTARPVTPAPQPPRASHGAPCCQPCLALYSVWGRQEQAGHGRGCGSEGPQLLVPWGHPQRGLRLLTLADPQESRPQTKEGTDASCLRPPSSAQTAAQVPTSSPWNWPLPTGDHSQMASLSARLGHLTPVPSSQAHLIRTQGPGPDRPEGSPAPNPRT